jgi:nucleoside-triphosphatase
MGTMVLLTGKPGSGKTTAIRRIISRLSREVSGFVTEEIREGGRRQGFKIITMDGHEGTLAHVDIRGAPRIGKYGVDLTAIEELVVKSLRSGLKDASLLIIDEIGPMEILSDPFRQVVMEVLRSDKDVLGTIVSRKLPFTERIKSYPNVTLLEIHMGNRDVLPEKIVQFFD